MKRWLRCAAGLGVVAALFAVVAGADAETCKLELKKVDESSEDESQWRFSMMSTSPQEFSMQLGETRGMIDEPVEATERPSSRR